MDGGDYLRVHAPVPLDAALELFAVLVEVKEAFGEDHNVIVGFGVGVGEDGLASELIILDDLLKVEFNVIFEPNDGASQSAFHFVV